MQKEIQVAKITITVSRRRKSCLLPGWEYGTHIEAESIRGADITPKDESVTVSIMSDVRKAIGGSK